MRTHTARTHRAAVILSGAVAALLVGGATAPAAYAQPGDKPASHGKKVGHAKKNDGSGKSSGSAGKSRASGDGDNRASSNKDGQGHNDQWQAQSDPDGDENGGIDQPGGDGGYNPQGWDGNNGSGNDPDCEDDNRGKGVPGHCKARPAKPAKAETPGSPQKAEKPGKPEQSEGQTRDGEDSTDETPAAVPTLPSGGRIVTETVTEVLGIERFSTTVTGTTSTSSASVAGRAPAAAATPAAEVAADATTDGMLPDTGADAAMLAMLAGGLAAAGAGTAMVRRGRASEG